MAKLSTLNLGFWQIPVIADLPVGENLQDHACLSDNIMFDNGSEANKCLISLAEANKISTKLQFLFQGKGKSTCETQYKSRPQVLSYVAEPIYSAIY